MKPVRPSREPTRPTPRRRAPLYVQIAQRLRAEIVEHHKVGDKLESGPTLAKRLGVSVLTVREAVNALTQEGLLDRRRGSGTYVRKPGTKPVAIVIGLSLADLRRSYFFLPQVHHLEELLSREKIPCRQYFAYVGADPAGQPVLNSMFLEDVHQRQVALVVPVSFTPTPALRQMLAAQDVPLVGQAAIETDYEGMVRAAVGYLLAHGRRRIALVQWPYEEIRQLFEALLRQAGIEPEPLWMRSSAAWYDADAPHQLFQQLWNARPAQPDGLICLNDFISERITPTILELGIRVPEQLMLVTHANKGSGIRYPFPVAQMEVDPEAYAAALADLVRRTLAGEPLPPLPLRMSHRWVPEQLRAGEERASR